MKKAISILALSLTFSAAASADSSNIHSCKLKVFSTAVELRITEISTYKIRGEVFQNNQLTLSSHVVIKETAKNLKDLYQTDARMAVDLAQNLLERHEASDIASLTSFEIDSAGNEDDANGATLLEVTLKSSGEKISLAQIGMAQGRCE
ncbi:MAG: hypothetical protein WC635_10805 [Bacteriovorax sp.]|jgi:hypothetical protein